MTTMTLRIDANDSQLIKKYVNLHIQRCDK